MGVTPELDTFDFARLTVSNAELKTGDTTFSGVPLFDCGYTDSDGVRGRLGKPGEQGTIGVLKIPAFDGGEGAKRLNELRAATTPHGDCGDA